jgi:hypothetical protein
MAGFVSLGRSSSFALYILKPLRIFNSAFWFQASAKPPAKTTADLIEKET